MSEHAALAPSAAKRWMNCPGSVAACAGKDSPDSVYSRKGTFGHSIAARVLDNDIDLVRSLLGTKSDGDGEFTLDEAMADAIQLYVNAVREVQMVEGGSLFVEQKVNLSADVWGTSDAVIWSDDKKMMHVFDLKLGQGVYVDVQDNEQLRIYALATLTEAGYDPGILDELTLHIVQPLYFGAAPHRTETITGKELREFRVRVWQAALDAKKPKAPLVAGEHCKFCPAAATCPALQQVAMTTAQELFPALDPTLPVTSPGLLALLPAAQIAKVLANLEAVESWVKAIRDHAYDRALKGEQIPGWKLVEKIGNRKWADEAAAVDALIRFGIHPFAPSVIASPAAIEKHGKSVKPLVAQLTVRPITGISLVPESDKRPAANPADAFPLLQ